MNSFINRLLISAFFCSVGHSASTAHNSFDTEISMAALQAELPCYDSDDEYKLHQQASERFFRRISKNPKARRQIIKFKKQFANEESLTRINLDDMSSRTRILLFKELTTSAKGKSISVPFIFHEKEFQLKLKPTLRQPGNAILTTIGTYKEIYNLLNIYTGKYQEKITKKLLSARRAKPYHPAIKHALLEDDEKTLDLEIFNILIDFEVARRFQGDSDEEKSSQFATKIKTADAYWNSDERKEAEKGERAWEIEFEMAHDFINRVEIPFNNHVKNLKKCYAENIKLEQTEYNKYSQRITFDRKCDYVLQDKQKLDSVPVSSAIVGALKIASKNDTSTALAEFVHADLPSTWSRSTEFPRGTWDAFEGEPAGTYRKDATAKIIKEFRGGKKAVNSNLKQIHQEYLEVYGGASESEGEDYYA